MLHQHLTAATGKEGMQGDMEMLSEEASRQVEELEERIGQLEEQLNEQQISERSPVTPTTTISEGTNTMPQVGVPFKKVHGTGDDSGHMYEVKMILLTFLRCVAQGVTFRLASNMQGTGKFDDLVLEVWGSGSCCPEKVTLVQLKHRSKPVSRGDLFKWADKFSVFTYFLSYRDEIVANFPGVRTELILYTNVEMEGFTGHRDNHKGFLSSSDGGVSAHFTRDSYPDIHGLQAYMDSYSQFLRQLAHDASMKSQGEVSDFIRKSVAEYRRDAKCRSVPNLVQKLALLEKCATLTCVNDLLKEIANLGDFSLYQEFLSKFQVYYCQADEKQLDSVIKEELKAYTGMCNVDEQFTELLDRFRRWWKKDDPYYLCPQEPAWAKLMQGIARKMSADKLTLLSALRMDVRSTQGSTLKKSLLNSKVLHVFVNGCSTLLSVCKVYRSLQEQGVSMMMVSLDAILENRDNVLDVWQSAVCDVLVVDVDRSVSGVKDLSALRSILERKSDKRLVVISNKNDLNATRSVKQLESVGGYSRCSESTSLYDLAATAQRKVLETCVTFQGYDVPLGRLMGQKPGEEEKNEELMKVVRDDLLVRLVKGERVKIVRDLPDCPRHYIARSMSRGGRVFDTDAWVQEERWQGGSPVVITGEPGMGKSTLVLHLARKAKERRRHSWVLPVRLNECTHVLKMLQQDSDMEDEHEDEHEMAVRFMAFLADREALVHGQLVHALFQHSWQVSGDFILLLVDGYDEIWPDYEAVVTRILRSFQLMDVKVVVTSRASCKAHLERVLSCLSFAIDPLDRHDQRSLLKKLWLQSLNDVDESLVDRHVENVCVNICEAMRDSESSFMGIPLQAVFVASLYTDINDTDNTDVHLDALELYERFFRRKCELYFTEKMGNEITKRSTRETFERYLHEADILHQKCALLALVSERDVAQGSGQSDDTVWTVIREEEQLTTAAPIELAGVISDVLDGRPRFVHRTFAEYFMAKWLSSNFRTNRSFIGSLVDRPSHSLVLHMFTEMLCKHSRLHACAWARDTALASSLLASAGVDVDVDVDGRDLGGRTALHLSVLVRASGATNEDHAMTRLLLEKGAQPSLRDAVLGWTALEYAERLAQWGAVECLLAGTDDGPQHMPHTVSRLRGKDAPFTRTLMRVSCERRYTRLVAFLAKNGVDVDDELDEEGHRGVHVVTGDDHASETVLDILLRHGADVNVQARDGRTPLHVFAHTGRVSLVRYLIVRQPDSVADAATDRLCAVLCGGKDVLMSQMVMTCVRDRDGNTAQQVAAIAGLAEVAHYLRSCPAFDSFLRNEPHAGDRKLQLESCVRYLVESLGADVNVCDSMGKSALHCAVRLGNEHVVRFLVGRGARLDARDRSSYTPLHMAVSQGNLQMVRCLLDLGEHGGVHGTDGEGALLLLAAHWGRLEVFVHLVQERGVHLETKGEKERRAVHIACQQGHADLVKFIVDHGGDVHCLDTDGCSALYLAVCHNRINVIKYLVENVGLSADHFTTAFRAAVIGGHLDLISYLAYNGGDVDCRDKEDATLVHLAAHTGDVRVLSYLLDTCRCAVTCQRSDGCTALHVAAAAGHLPAVRELVSSGADVNALNHVSDSALHVAVRHNRLDVVTYLVQECHMDPDVAGQHGQTCQQMAQQREGGGGEEEENDVSRFLHRLERNTRRIASDVSSFLDRAQNIEKHFRKTKKLKGLF